MKPKYFKSQANAIDANGIPVLVKPIGFFPYPERYCPYCEGKLEVAVAVHLPGNEDVFKAIFQCLNDDCGAYDEEGHMAYVRVYYSSNLALELYETVFLKLSREIKD